MNDINKAVERLNGTTRKHISHIDYATALGLQARIALVMEDWATAKKSSEEAISRRNLPLDSARADGVILQKRISGRLQLDIVKIIFLLI